jgi:hypothetical protein
MAGSHVVVVFGGPADGCDLSHCPMYVHGPYTRLEAIEVMRQLPEWQKPHHLTLGRDDDVYPPGVPASEGEGDDRG